MSSRNRGDTEEGLRTAKPARYNDARKCRKDDRAEHSGAPSSDDFFHDKEDGGDGRIEGRRQAGRGANGSE
jgi:hypothetical protein